MTATPATAVDACDGLTGAAFGLCNAFCNAQDCPADPTPSCEVLRGNFAEHTGSSVFPCEQGTPVGTRTPGDIECTGDCGGDGRVDVSDLTYCVLIVLGERDDSECTGWIHTGLSIDELVLAVDNALDGCG